MIIDLTAPLGQQTPVYPGDPPVSIAQTATVADNGYQLHSLQLGTHVGTHIDAPAHMLPDGRTLGSYPADKFVGTGVYIAAPGGQVTPALLESVALTGDSIVLFHTGASDHYDQPGYFTDVPVLSQEVADYLVRKGVKMVGLDTCSADNGEAFPIHQTLLGADILIIENLVGLDRLANKQCTVYALPLKLDLDGAPARVIAEVA